MTIKQLYPTQRPALDLNFAQQNRLDSRVSLTRASIGTYVGSDGLIKTAASGEARFDHDPVTGESLGLLVEEARTNQFTYSDFGNAIWNAANISKISTNNAAPDGSNTAVLIGNSTGGTNGSFLRYALNVTGTKQTFTFYAKATTTGQSAFIDYYDFGTTRARAGISLDDGNVTYVSQTGDGVITSANAGNGWWRCQLTLTPNGNGVFEWRAGNYDSGDIYVWGVQLEAGSFPTSYIPTSGSTVTRSADVASLTNSSIYNTDSFTILNEPFGSAAGSSTLSLVGAGKTPIKRTAVYSQNLTQTQINASVGKTDEFWRWRILGDSFGLPNFATNGQVTVDWGDGTVETLTTSDHTFTDGGGYHDIGFRLDSGTYFRPYINNNASHVTKVVAVGPAPESMKFDAQRAFFACTNLEAFDAAVDLSGGTDLYRAWRACSNLKSFPALDTSSISFFDGTWANCSSLTSFPLLNTATGTSFTEAWLNCTGLTSFPLIDTSSGTNFNQTWRSCESLTSFPAINVSSGTTFYYAWRYCYDLVSFPANFFDSWTGTPADNCFVFAWSNCTSLTATSVENILNSIDTSNQSAPASGVDITIDYDAGTGTPSVATAVTNLKSRGWTITLNGVAQ
jgi:hypothetical protein